METDTNSIKYNIIDYASLEAKNFYSAGSSFTTLACAAAVHISWGVLESFYPILSKNVCGLVLCFLLVFAYAIALPEPPGYKNEGKMRLTVHEIIFGFFNSLIVFSIVNGFRHFHCFVT